MLVLVLMRMLIVMRLPIRINKKRIRIPMLMLIHMDTNTDNYMNTDTNIHTNTNTKTHTSYMVGTTIALQPASRPAVQPARLAAGLQPANSLPTSPPCSQPASPAASRNIGNYMTPRTTSYQYSQPPLVVKYSFYKKTAMALLLPPPLLLRLRFCLCSPRPDQTKPLLLHLDQTNRNQARPYQTRTDLPWPSRHKQTRRKDAPLVGFLSQSHTNGPSLGARSGTPENICSYDARSGDAPLV